MSGPNHIVGGVVFTGLYLSMWDKNIYGQPHFLFFTAFFAVLPDIDHTRSLIGKSFYPVAKWLDRKFGHRTITHSLLCYIALGIIIGVIERTWLNSTDITKIFFWAYGSHLIFDMLTLQGIPLFYPFKNNPCVLPGNPKMRFRSSDIKAESVVFVLFVTFAFLSKDLFANGFWNTYNTNFGTVKHLHNEQLLSDNLIEVDYKFTAEGKDFEGYGILISSIESKAIIFNENAGFITISREDKAERLKPIRTSRKLQKNELSFTAISYDSLGRVISGKPIQDLKLQSTLPISYTKENKPQSGTSIELSCVLNPILLSGTSDSVDATVQKDIELIRMDISRNHQEQERYKAEKNKPLIVPCWN